jgi:hypothetical protein
MKYPIIFNVWPGRGTPKKYHIDTKLYWEVSVYKTRRNMKEAQKEYEPYSSGDDSFGAIVIPLHTISFTTGKEVHSPSLGHVLFSTKQLGMETIAHEAFHMAMGFWERREPSVLIIPPDADPNENEERLAYTIGNCARQINKNLWDNKIFK